MSIKSNHNFAYEFSFEGWDFDVVSGQLTCHYFDSQFGQFTERFVFPSICAARYSQCKTLIHRAIDCLYWMAGVSYYKTSLAQKISFKSTRPTIKAANWLTQTWQAGLAELAFENNLGWLHHVKIAGDNHHLQHLSMQLQKRSLVAIGGGKDSLVSIAAIKEMGEDASLFMVGQSAFIKSVAAQTNLPLLSINRVVDQRLKLANQEGAYNGHIPITAINSCVAVVAALLYDFDSVVFSNERSADVGNVLDESGQWVNHQYSKSLEYEQSWQQIIAAQMTPELHCFSLLRPFSELAIVKRFAALDEYFPHFSSCNRNFHLTGSHNHGHHWCGECPKCAFVFLCLAPFVTRNQLLDIFKKNLFDDDALTALFESLLGIKGLKPFECVGEQQECRLAVALLGTAPEWKSHHRVLAWQSILPEIEKIDKVSILAANERHLIPEKRNFRRIITHEA